MKTCSPNSPTDADEVECGTFIADSPVDPREKYPPYEHLLHHVSITCVDDENHPTRIGKEPLRKRRRVELPQSDIWLDRLPDGVCRRIAVYLTSGRQTNDALRFARVSPKQRLAVLAVLNNEIKVRSERELLTWGALYPETVTELEAWRDQWIEPATVAELSVFPLRRIWLKAHASLLTQLRRSIRLDMLREVELEVDSLKKDTRTALFAFLSAATAVRTLSINWDELKRPDIVEADKVSFAKQLASACPRLQSLHVFRFWFNRKMHFPWRILQLLPELRKLRVDQLPQSDSMERLKGLERVRLICSGAAAVAHKLGASVTELATGYVTAQSLSKLTCCTRLDTLRLGLRDGAEKKLLEVVHAAPDIRWLELKWDLSQRLGQSCYFTPTPNLLLDCIRSLPNLNKLELHHVKVSTAELQEMLRLVGNRLLQFGTALLGQVDSPLERLQALMDTVCTCNHAIRSWSFSNGEQGSAIVEHTRRGPRVYVNKDEQNTRWDERKRLLSFLPYLRQRAPYLSTLGLEIFITSAELPHTV